MAGTTTECRITAADITAPISDIVERLAGDNVDSMNVLTEWLMVDPFALPAFLSTLDMKHLYDEHIWKVYSEVCGGDIHRFIYHVQMELPNQATGQLSITGKYAGLADETFFAKRQFGAPGSYWALEHPPTTPYYAFPID